MKENARTGSRGRRFPSRATQGVEPLGSVRRSQLISTFGIGSVVDLEKGSFMPMGLEDWERMAPSRSQRLQEARLEDQLGVNHFRVPPTIEPVPGTKLVDSTKAIPSVRFPLWHECPKCHRIGTMNSPFEINADGSRLQCLAHGGAVVVNPVRLVLACRAGHASDFPWVWWAHQHDQGSTCSSPTLYLRSRGQSAALGDLYVFCSSCRASKSLGKAFGLNQLGSAACRGSRPWLHDRENDCKQRSQVVQRGASNFHFPIVASALSIPPVSDAAFQIVDEVWDILRSVPSESVNDVLAGQADLCGVDVNILKAALAERRSIEEGNFDRSERSMRAEEYAALTSDRDDEVIGGVVPQFQNQLLQPSNYLAPWFDVIGAVHRLREVRALAAFARVEPWPISPDRLAGAVRDGKVAPLSKTPRSWLPAAEIRGEGIFLRFKAEAIQDWLEKNPEAARRASQIDSRSAAVANERGFEREYEITPSLLLVHSFSHALIRQISIDCGYSSAALRERLFIGEAMGSLPAMHGVLIYTGSPDSEGSLGGLVRLAEPDLLEDVIRRTIHSAQWCGSDPVCLERTPQQSGDRISAAACHCCLLLPETACEKFNRELDRSMLIGDSTNTFGGFFLGG